jgi:tripartite-type tricarboxylate transporter receptor subunit TctC
VFLAPYGKRYDDYAKQGKLKVLAMLNKDRLESVKAHPSMGEGKQLKDFTFNIWTGYFVKRDTPEPAVQTLHAAITKTLGDPAVRQGLRAHSLLSGRAGAIRFSRQGIRSGYTTVPKHCSGD